MAQTASLCNNSSLTPPHGDQKQWGSVGDPTEVALQVLAAKMGIEKANYAKEQGWEFIHEYPFDPTIKRMTVMFREGEGKDTVRAFMKGAVERVGRCCEGYYDENGKVQPMNDGEQATC